jgi:hypothetical protein
MWPRLWPAGSLALEENLMNDMLAMPLQAGSRFYK